MASDPEKKADLDTVEQLSDKLDDSNSDKVNDERINAFTPEEQKKIIRRSMLTTPLTPLCHADMLQLIGGSS
jgi:hypothetical protein